MTYAYVCIRCRHLTSRHYLQAGATTIMGPYQCSHRDCVCVIDQTTPAAPIRESVFIEEFADTLDEYEPPASGVVL
jgi:hypothetical protein